MKQETKQLLQPPPPTQREHSRSMERPWLSVCTSSPRSQLLVQILIMPAQTDRRERPFAKRSLPLRPAHYTVPTAHWSLCLQGRGFWTLCQGGGWEVHILMQELPSTRKKDLTASTAHFRGPSSNIADCDWWKSQSLVCGMCLQGTQFSLFSVVWLSVAILKTFESARLI